MTKQQIKAGDTVVFTDVNTYGYCGWWVAPGAPGVVTDGPDSNGEYGVMTTLPDCNHNQLLWFASDDIQLAAEAANR